MLKNHHFYRFGSFRLDPEARVLLKENEPVRLTKKAVETLLVLVENAGQVLTKEEIISSVWGDRVVDEANLTQNIAVIRRTLGGSTTNTYIETFPGRGYRFVAPVEKDTRAPASTLATMDAPSSGGGPTPRRIALYAAGALLILAIASTLWWGLRREPENVRITPLTRLAGKEYQPALSPDGSRVAFAWAQTGSNTAGIWYQDSGDTSPRQVTTKEGNYSSPAWSPDGDSLAYLHLGKAATEVLIFSLASGRERVVATLAPSAYGVLDRMLDWSPKGDLLVVSYSASPDKVMGLFVISVATGNVKPLTDSGETVGGDRDPRFSPDGRTVSFIRFILRSQQEIFTVPVTGGPAAQVTSDNSLISGHDWMPDGRTLVVASNRGGEFRLWRIPAAPGGAPKALGIYGEFPLQLSRARRSDTLAYAILQQDRNIWRLDFNGARWSRLIATSAQDASPQYSPHADRICFRSDRSGEDQLWVSAADGSHPVQVTRGPLRPSFGRWSPDGRSIVFNSSKTELYVATEDGRDTWTTRPLGVSAFHPVYSPDGRWIYAASPQRILRLPTDGGPASGLVQTRALSLDVSSDGRFVYFLREPHDTRIWRADTATGEVQGVLEGLLPACTSCWSLAPGGIYFLGSDPQSYDRQVLSYHDLRTGGNRVVAEYPEPLWPLGSGPFSLSPDGRSLLCVRIGPSESDIMQVKPFR